MFHVSELLEIGVYKKTSIPNLATLLRCKRPTIRIRNLLARNLRVSLNVLTLHASEKTLVKSHHNVIWQYYQIRDYLQILHANMPE